MVGSEKLLYRDGLGGINPDTLPLKHFFTYESKMLTQTGKCSILMKRMGTVNSLVIYKV